MAKEELIEMQGKVDEVLPDSRFPRRFIVVERLDWRKAIDRFGSIFVDQKKLGNDRLTTHCCQ